MAGTFIVDTVYLLYQYVYFMAPFWVGIGLGYALWHAWLYYVRARMFFNKEYVLLEIKIPEEIVKTPVAMEVLLGYFHQTVGEGTWYSRRVEGKVRAYFSLEIVSLEGQVKFFIRVEKFLQKTLETQIYSQYPNVEIYEVPDYTNAVPYGKGGGWSLWGSEIVLSEKDSYPIKTYVDYGLDKPTRDDTEKNDPMTPLIEYLGSMGPGEQAWYQIIIRANKGKKDPTTFWPRDWKKEGEEAIEEIMAKYKRGGPEEDSGGETASIMTPGDKMLVEAISRSLTKLAFDCGMRVMYLAKDDKFKPQNIPGVIGSLKQFGSPHLNGFMPNLKTITDKDYPWQDYKDILVNRKRARLFDAYRRRSYFFPPYERKPFLLTTEELATVFHFPGGVAQTPTFGRITSRKAEPPTNLPVGD